MAFYYREQRESGREDSSIASLIRNEAGFWSSYPEKLTDELKHRGDR